MTEPLFPTSALVGHRRVRVEVWPDAEADAAGHFGDYRPTHRMIRVQRTGCAAEDANTLLHELLHVVTRDHGIQAVDAPGEEYVVLTCANGLCQVMRDNPEVLHWLLWAWTQPS